MLAILGAAAYLKLVLHILCVRVAERSKGMAALAEDHFKSAVSSAGAFVIVTSAFLWCCSLPGSLFTCSEARPAEGMHTWTRIGGAKSYVPQSPTHSSDFLVVQECLRQFFCASGLGTKQARNIAVIRRG